MWKMCLCKPKKKATASDANREIAAQKEEIKALSKQIEQLVKIVSESKDRQPEVNAVYERSNRGRGGYRGNFNGNFNGNFGVSRNFSGSTSANYGGLGFKKIRITVKAEASIWDKILVEEKVSSETGHVAEEISPHANNPSHPDQVQTRYTHVLIACNPNMRCRTVQSVLWP